MSEEKKPTIDERLDALVTSTEVLQGMMHDSLKRTDKLEALVASHEQEWQRFRRAMRAALEAWLEDGDQGAPQG